MTRLPFQSILAFVFLAAAISFVSLSEAGAQPISFSVVSTDYLDLNGDLDMFPDTNETGRVVIVVQNGAVALTKVKFQISSTDPDVTCFADGTVSAGTLASGQTISLGSFNPAQPGFEFRVSDTMQTIDPNNPAEVELCLVLKAKEIPQGTAPVCFSLPADLDAGTGGSQTFVAGPDGIPGNSDDGTVLETFDVDRDGDGNITVNDTFRLADAGTGTTGHGSYLRGANASSGTTVGGIACAGFQTPGEGNPGCALDPDFPFDWHVHCAPGATNCPNVETGTCVGGCSYATPTDGTKALSAPNSLHMGAHFDPDVAVDGDTTHFRSMQGFVSGPLNLAQEPREGDLQLSMHQIVDLMDDNGVGPNNDGMCSDCGDVQIQVDTNPDPAADAWGTWDKLAPFQNVYDHTPLAVSTFGAYYCLFTPTDTGTAPPAPRGVHETICYPQGAWSHCGSVRGTTSANVNQCDGPGVVDPTGIGVWVETRFNLETYIGQRVRLRWIGSSWLFDTSSSSYYEVGGSWAATQQDDGWWLDDINVTGVVTSQGGGSGPVPDDDEPPDGQTCHGN